uniref:Uncharacterized protein n=1 Tax=Brassica campestris TaxID=3711 RepID=M4FCR5_BRACM
MRWCGGWSNDATGLRVRAADVVGGVRVGRRSKLSDVEGVVLAAKLSYQFRCRKEAGEISGYRLISPLLGTRGWKWLRR